MSSSLNKLNTNWGNETGHQHLLRSFICTASTSIWYCTVFMICGHLWLHVTIRMIKKWNVREVIYRATSWTVCLHAHGVVLAVVLREAHKQHFSPTHPRHTGSWLDSEPRLAFAVLSFLEVLRGCTISSRDSFTPVPAPFTYKNRSGSINMSLLKYVCSSLIMRS